MESSFTAVLICLLVAAGIHFTSACNGYSARLMKLENCGGDDQVLKIDPNVTISLTTECDVVIAGCAETNGMATAKFKYTILKNGNRITSGTFDLCAEFEKDAKGLSTTLMSFGLPKQCPIEKMRKCADGSQKMSVTKQKSFLSLVAGNIDISIEGTHDTGKTCLHGVLNLKKEK